VVWQGFRRVYRIGLKFGASVWLTELICWACSFQWSIKLAKLKLSRQCTARVDSVCTSHGKLSIRPRCERWSLCVKLHLRDKLRHKKHKRKDKRQTTDTTDKKTCLFYFVSLVEFDIIHDRDSRTQWIYSIGVISPSPFLSISVLSLLAGQTVCSSIGGTDHVGDPMWRLRYRKDRERSIVGTFPRE